MILAVGEPQAGAVTEAEFAARMGATAAQMADLRTYRDLLMAWNGRVNLVGPSAEADFWGRHALDSAQLFHVEQQAMRWADVGTGAGLPGVVLAILLKGRATAWVHLVESLGKRAVFLRHVCETLALPATVHQARAEDLRPPPQVDVVTARACAPLSRLLGYTAAFFQNGARGLFLKGKTVEAEIEEARKSWRFRADLVESLSDPSGRILRVDGVSRRG